MARPPRQPLTREAFEQLALELYELHRAAGQAADTWAQDGPETILVNHTATTRAGLESARKLIAEADGELRRRRLDAALSSD